MATTLLTPVAMPTLPGHRPAERAFRAPRPAVAVEGPRQHPLRQLRGVILLGGAVRETTLRAGIGRSLLDLPVGEGRSLLDRWLDDAADFARHLGLPRLPVRLILDEGTRGPASRAVSGRAPFSIERDPAKFRGTGGTLRDCSRVYAADDYVLVANAAQLPRRPLQDVAGILADREADVALVAHRDGTPSGFMLVRCGCLHELPAAGFIDMKEQGLPLLAGRHRVEVAELAEPSGLPIRTAADYIRALRHEHRSGGPAGAFAESWDPAFSILEDPSDVHPKARVHDSVILKGGRVEEGAVVVGSVICPGAVARRGRMTVDQLLTPATR